MPKGELVTLPIVVAANDAGPKQYLRQLDNRLPLKWLSHPEDLYALNTKICLTGTTLGESIDKQLLRKCLVRGIHCISIIDHWSWYRKRFETAGELLIPHEIFVNDELAKEEAVNEGLPRERLVVVGNPVLESLAIEARKRITVDRQSPNANRDFDDSDRGTTSKTILYISEELRSSFKSGTEDYLGYDEFEVLESVLSVVGPDDQLIVKLHPAEDAKKYQYVADQVAIIEGTVSIHELSEIADIIIGTGSMLLLELSTIRTDVVSFRPGATKPFVGNRVGATIPIETTEELARFISAPWHTESDFGRRFIGSLDRIVRHIRRYID